MPLHPPLSPTPSSGLPTSLPKGLSLSLDVSSSMKPSLTSSIPTLSAHQVLPTLHCCNLFICILPSTVAQVLGTLEMLPRISEEINC